MSSRRGRAAFQTISLAAVVGLLVLLIGPLLGPDETVYAQAAAPVAQPAQPAQPSGPAAAAHVDTASYDLTARWDAGSNRIDGTATITYRNYSADTLGEIWLKLYLNAFRSDCLLYTSPSPRD